MEAGLTLNQIAYNIAELFGRAYDNMFIEQLKFNINYWRAELIRRDSERNNISKIYLQEFTTNLQKVDIGDTCVVDIGCKVLRTTSEIPTPIRPKDADSLFKSVGTPDGRVQFTYTDMQELRYVAHNRYTSNIIRYQYRNKHLYIYGNKLPKYVYVEAIFANPSQLRNVRCDGKECYTDDMEYPMGMDMIRTITEGIIQGKMRLLGQEEQEVTINEEQ